MHTNDFGTTAIAPITEIHALYSLHAQRLDKMLNIELITRDVLLCTNTSVYAAFKTTD
jgi:hypothetical protein